MLEDVLNKHGWTRKERESWTLEENTSVVLPHRLVVA